MMAERQTPRPKWQTDTRRPPWLPPYFDSSYVQAFKAVWAGEGTPEQQRAVLDWIIHHGGQYGEISYRSERDGGALDTAFAEGRRFVAQQVQKLIGLDHQLVAKLREAENAGTSSNTGPGSRVVDPDKHAKSGSR